MKALSIPSVHSMLLLSICSILLFYYIAIIIYYVSHFRDRYWLPARDTRGHLFKMESDAFHEFTNMIFAGTFHLMQLTWPGWVPAIISLCSSSSVVKLRAHCNVSRTVRWSSTSLNSCETWSSVSYWFCVESLPLSRLQLIPTLLCFSYRTRRTVSI